MVQCKQINDHIFYLPNSREPLSAETYFLQGKEDIYVFDVGAKKENCAEIERENPVIVLSHFHGDHIGNMKWLHTQKVYGSKQTAKYVPEVFVVEEAMKLDPMVEIGLLPSSHAKGCVYLNWNREYLFVGDALYAKTKGTQLVYNVSLLQETIHTLQKLDAKYVVMSHREKTVRKEFMIRFLEKTLEKREQGSNFISVTQ